MNSNRKLILTTILVSATLISFANAGFAERWEINLVKDCFFSGTIFVVQAITIIVCLIIGQKRNPFYNLLMVFCKKTAKNRYLQILIGGLLLSVNIGIYADSILGGLFIFGPLVFLGLMILNFIFAVSPRDGKWLYNPQVLYYLSILLIVAPIGVIAYYYAIQWPWLEKIYSYEMIIDSTLDDTDTIKPATLSHHFFSHILIYSIALYIPWVLGVVAKQICDYVSSLFAKKKSLNPADNEIEKYKSKKLIN